LSSYAIWENRIGFKFNEIHIIAYKRYIRSVDTREKKLYAGRFGRSWKRDERTRAVTGAWNEKRGEKHGDGEREGENLRNGI